MARIRTIKPVFARHEKLQELESLFPELRPMLTFCCLWTQCDREGRFEWKLKQLKLDILPFVDYPLEKAMELLAEHDFIRSYEVGGKVYGYVPTWADHQCPNTRESPSRLPAPPKNVAGMAAGEGEHFAGTGPGDGEPSAGVMPGHDASGRGRAPERDATSTGVAPGRDASCTGMVPVRDASRTSMMPACGERERERERKKGMEREFNPMEAARALAVERGWSGVRVIEQIKLAIVAIQTQFPERRAAEIADWLLQRTHEYEQCAKVKAGFKMSWEKFFGEAHYNDPAESWECRSGGGGAVAAATAAIHTEDATPLIRERQKKLEEFLARRKQTTQQVQ